MNTKKSLVCGLIAATLVFALAFTACEEPDAPLSHISAVYSGTAAIYPNTPLDNLKADLTVTAQSNDNTTRTLDAAEYTLSGTLTSSYSRITVTYQDKTTIFGVTVTFTGTGPNGLVYTFITDGSNANTYSVSRGTATGDVVIPAFYKDFPVMEISGFGGDSSNPNTSLTSITFENGSQLQTIGERAFNNCTKLTTVTFGSGSQLQTIGGSAFYNCTSLTTVTFGSDSQLQTIGDSAFQSCASLTSITIPASVTSIRFL